MNTEMRTNNTQNTPRVRRRTQTSHQNKKKQCGTTTAMPISRTHIANPYGMLAVVMCSLVVLLFLAMFGVTPYRMILRALSTSAEARGRSFALLFGIEMVSVAALLVSLTALMFYSRGHILNGQQVVQRPMRRRFVPHQPTPTEDLPDPFQYESREQYPKRTMSRLTRISDVSELVDYERRIERQAEKNKRTQRTGLYEDRGQKSKDGLPPILQKQSRMLYGRPRLTREERERMQTDLQLIEGAEKLYRELRISSMMQIWSDSIRGFICDKVMGEITRLFAESDKFFIEAKYMELRHPQTPEFRKIELSAIEIDRCEDLYSYFKRYYGNEPESSLIRQKLGERETLYEIIKATMVDPQLWNYCIKRIKDLSLAAFLSAYRWDGGGDWRGQHWNNKLPCDAELVMKTFCMFVEKWTGLEMMRNHYIPYNESQNMFGVSELGAWDREQFCRSRVVAIVEYSYTPRYYCLAVDEGQLKSESSPLEQEHRVLSESLKPQWRLWKTQSGPDNVFHTIALFVYFIQSRKHSQLFSFNLNQLGLGFRMN